VLGAVLLSLLSNLGTAEDFTVVKLAGAGGGEQWRRVVDGPGHTFDAAVAVAADPKGNVVAAGITEGAAPPRGFTVMKLAGRSGGVRWDRRLEGTAHLDRGDAATSVALDRSGHVFATGVLYDLGTGFDLAVLRLRSRTGRGGGCLPGCPVALH